MKKSSESEYIPALRFHWLTPYYDVVVSLTTREHTFKHALISQTNIKPDNRVLDLASGTGTLALWIKKHQPQAIVTGIDGDDNVLSLAIRKAHKESLSVKFEKALSYNLPFPDSHYDRVVSSLFFHHLSWADKVKTANEIYRVLKPGGEIHIADWGRSENSLMRGLFFFIQILDGFKNTQDNVTGKLIPLFEQSGFIEVKQKNTFSTMFGTMALYSAVKPG
jgi:ubiquinone/menaquinone biosynthesis C-methylase UbiE